MSVTVSTEADCRDQCMSQASFICAAVNFKPDSSNNCELLAENDKTARYDKTINGWSYHVRPLCAGRFFILVTICNKDIEHYPKLGLSRLKLF